MEYLIGFVLGVVVCAVAAHTYIQTIVNKEITALRSSLVAFKATIEARITEAKSKL